MHGFKTVPVMACSQLNDLQCQGRRDLPDFPTPEYYIPLAGFEKAILHETQTQHHLRSTLSCSSPDLLRSHLFHNWQWSYHVQSSLLDCLCNAIPCDCEPKEHQKKHDLGLCSANPCHCEPKEHQRKYDLALELAANIDHIHGNDFRIRDLVRHNPNFPDRLGRRQVWSVKFKPPLSDHGYWDVLAAMFSTCSPLMLFWMNAPERRRLFKGKNEPLEWKHSHFSVWQIVRIFDLWSRRQHNAESIAALSHEAAGPRPSLTSMSVCLRRIDHTFDRKTDADRSTVMNIRLSVDQASDVTITLGSDDLVFTPVFFWSTHDALPSVTVCKFIVGS